MLNLNEFQTRKQRIDVFLKEQGWDVNDPSQVRVEIDTKQSDFKKRDYKEVSETLKNEDESKYADYLLLDSRGDPIAIIEAKRTSKDPLVGKKQSEEYAEDIMRQTGKPLFIFLTNGDEIWFWNWNNPTPYESMRLTKGFYNLDALERKKFQNENQVLFSKLKIRTDIINRDYQIESVKRVLDGIERGRRKFLIVQATGTGKTRVSMALADILMKSKRVQKVLFLADRKALRDQAYSDGYKQFFPNESRDKIFSGKIDKTKRLYVSTIQTFMECYQEFSPGDFDLIISDESHRSIYNKWKDVFTYFDAIQVGLTATPSELVDKDTLRFFNCEDGKPTCLYEFEDAVDEGWLVPFRVHSSQTHFQIEGVKPKDVPDMIKKELADKGVEEDDINFEGTDIEKKVIIKGTNEAIVREFYDNCIFDKSGTLPAKTIFFAVSKHHAKRLWEAFNNLYPEYKSKLAAIITSDDSRAQELVKQFKRESMPRIAISVDMLDTGVDIPEVCNLVFAKPVFSKIKFWQMIGRGTRNDETCKHKDWLPAGKKENFLIFDCWNNFEWFNIHPKGREPSSNIALPSRVFLIRINQYKILKNKKEGEEVLERIRNDILSLPKNTISIKEKRKELDLALSDKIWKNIGLNAFEFLKTQITPLMRFKEINLDTESFVLKVERLGLAILEKNKEEIKRLSESIVESINCLPRSINEVKQKSDLLDKISESPFWKKITYPDYLILLKEIAPLMKYKRKEPIPKISLDIGDVVQQRKLIEFGPSSNPQQEYAKVYKEKVENKIKNIAKKHPTIIKIKNNKEITEKDIEKLEETLNSPDLFITEETLRKTYDRPKGTLLQFIKAILGLYSFPEPQKLVEEAFKTYMISRSDLNADQIRFLITLKNVFLQKKSIEMADLYEAPFTNIGKAPKPLFKEDELKELVVLCKTVGREVF
jgi:type I restriction enzyme R subunit